MKIEDSFYIGYISKTRGLKGELQLFFDFDEYEALTLNVLFLEMDHRLVPFFVSSVNVQANRTAYLFLEDVDGIDKAQALVRKKVYLPNEQRPVRSSDDFRITDLKGFTVYDSVRGELGEITDVQHFPQQYIASVIYQGNELMFPLTDEWMVGIDRQARQLQINLPDGLIDVYLQG